MRDLRSRWNLLVLLVALVGAMPGCSALQADPRSAQSNRDNDSLLANSADLNFGSVVVGNSLKAAEYVSNPTSAAVTITSAISSTGDFQVISPVFPATVPSGKGITLMVRFAPEAAGYSSAKVIISSNASQPTISVPVLGEAIAAGKLVVAPSSVSFGDVAVGKSQSKPESFTNSGDTSVTISQVTVNSKDFAVTGITLPVTLKSSQIVSFNVVFTPSASGAHSGNVSASATASLVAPASGFQTSAADTPQVAQPTSQSETATLVVAGMGTAVSSSDTTLGQLTAAPASFSFGSPQVGSSQNKALIITNTGTASVTVTQATATGAGYTLTGPSFPLTLVGGQTASFTVTFAPHTAGTADGSVTVVSSAANPTLDVELSATPVSSGVLTVSSNPVAFGTVTVGSSQKTSATVTNAGGSSVTLTQATVTGTGFSMTGMGMPMTLGPNQSANLSITCAPQSAGALTGSLSIASNASNTNVAVPLTATAVMGGALTATATSLSFGKVTVGSSQTLPETLTNSGATSITLTQVAAGAGYSVTGLSLPLTLNAGQSTSFSVAFAPQSAVSSTVNLAITDNGSTPTVTIPLSGTGVTSGTLVATSVSFGSVQVGSSTTQTATLTNSGGSSVTVSQANLTGTGFTMTGMSLPLTLSAGQSLTFSVTFAPQSAGSDTGSIALVSNASGTTPSISLSGSATAAGQFSISPGSFSFGSVAVGASKSLPATVSAASSSVTVTSASVSTSEFALSGPSLPLTIPAGGTASFTLTFTPQSSGAAAATVSFATNASASPSTESLSGSGTAAVQHAVNLSWSESSTGVAGYNIYRSGTTGGPYAKLDGSTDTNTSYTDSSVQAGQTYYYVTTSVGTDGSESAYSNQVSAAVPAP